MAWALFLGSILVILCCFNAIASSGSNVEGLFFGLMTETQDNDRALSGIIDALSYINERDDLLPGYELRYIHIFKVNYTIAICATRCSYNATLNISCNCCRENATDQQCWTDSTGVFISLLIKWWL